MRRTPPLHQGNEKRSYSFSRAAHVHETPGERVRERVATGKARYEALCTACTATCPGRTAEGRLSVTNGHESTTNLSIKPSLVLSRVVRLVLLVCVGHRDSCAPRNKESKPWHVDVIEKHQQHSTASPVLGAGCDVPLCGMMIVIERLEIFSA